MKKTIKKITFLSFLLILTACPKIGPCMEDSLSKDILDLVKISPLQNAYSIGDEIEITMVLSSNQDFSDQIVDIYQKTGL